MLKIDFVGSTINMKYCDISLYHSSNILLPVFIQYRQLWSVNLMTVNVLQALCCAIFVSIEGISRAEQEFESKCPITFYILCCV